VAGGAVGFACSNDEIGHPRQGQDARQPCDEQAGRRKPARNLPLKIASSRLGQSSIGITANVYQHLSSDMDAEAAERVAPAVSNLA
jgi:hypothetical protein